MRYSQGAGSARITEIFSSLQGEGPRMGERQLFIRFEACQLQCRYCDERTKQGSRMSLAEVLGKIDALEKKDGPHAYVSLTGGEPLLYAGFLKPLCRALKKRRFKILLETNGVLAKELGEVRSQCDWIAMDVKLASVGGGRDLLKEHREFLCDARGNKTYVKIMVSQTIEQQEYEAHLRMIASVGPKVPVFLQPVGQKGERLPDLKLLKLMHRLQRIGKKHLPDIRLGVQLHKILNIR